MVNSSKPDGCGNADRGLTPTPSATTTTIDFGVAEQVAQHGCGRMWSSTINTGTILSSVSTAEKADLIIGPWQLLPAKRGIHR